MRMNFLFIAVLIAGVQGIHFPLFVKDVEISSFYVTDGYTERKMYDYNQPTTILNQTHSIVTFDNGSVFGSVIRDGYLFDLDGGVEKLVNITDDPLLKNISCPVDGVEATNEMHPFVPNCFRSDEITRILELSIVVDKGFFELFDSDVDKTMDFISVTIVKARLLYKEQFNIVLKIAKTHIETSRDAPFPLLMSPGDDTCTRDPSYVLSEFAKWSDLLEFSQSGGTVHAFTNCWPAPGVVGIAYMSTLCNSAHGNNIAVTSYVGTNTWLIFAHELGHNLGAHHVFGVGGIMDYGNPYWDGTIQFHPNNRDEMCFLLNAKTECPFFYPTSPLDPCGNGLLDDDEQCECLDGTQACSGCKRCQFTKQVDCSTDTFVMRAPGQTTTIVSNAMLSDPLCCKSGEFETAYTECPVGVCSLGQCIRLCGLYGLKTCPISYHGCRQPCVSSTTLDGVTHLCTDSLTTMSTKKKISYLPDGSVCGSRKQGRCVDGECTDGETTDAPFPNERETAAPSSGQPRGNYCGPPIWKERCAKTTLRWKCNRRLRCTYSVGEGKCVPDCSWWNS